uniref:Zinc finger (CCCH type), RNA binding motif and serine/arginine rich 2 n=1 Tax=Mus musculus TaxID=10090 RepID=Q4KKX6_MOUSE|nr:Zinc finger (CCCH type), RNA binding motif and serine/arginine rich 2 [Mus musculus]
MVTEGRKGTRRIQGKEEKRRGSSKTEGRTREKVKGGMGRTAEKRARGRGAETTREERKRGDFCHRRIEPCVSSWCARVHVKSLQIHQWACQGLPLVLYFAHVLFIWKESVFVRNTTSYLETLVSKWFSSWGGAMTDTFTLSKLSYCLF